MKSTLTGTSIQFRCRPTKVASRPNASVKLLSRRPVIMCSRSAEMAGCGLLLMGPQSLITLTLLRPLRSGTDHSVEIDYRRVGGFFDTFEEGGLTGMQASYAALKPPSTIAGYNAVVIAAGISNEYEGEGEDRSFTLPEFQDELIKNVSAANPRTVVVFYGGGNFDSEQWINQVDGLIEAFYPGQLGGQALAEILFGDVNPSGKLPITMEVKASDNPAYATFPNPVNQHPDDLMYTEGVFIGYRGYEKSGI